MSIRTSADVGVMYDDGTCKPSRNMPDEHDGSDESASPSQCSRFLDEQRASNVNNAHHIPFNVNLIRMHVHAGYKNVESNATRTLRQMPCSW